MTELPNIDCMDEDELREYASLLHKVNAYVSAKVAAIVFRKSGMINKAVEQERTCDILYRRLPAESRW